MFRRQCYNKDGNISEQRTGVAITDLESLAVSSHFAPQTRYMPFESRIIYHATVAESVFEPCAIHTRWTIKVDALGSIISNCIVLQSMWNYAKDVDRARYGEVRIHELS